MCVRMHAYMYILYIYNIYINIKGKKLVLIFIEKLVFNVGILIMTYSSILHGELLPIISRSTL